MSDEKVGHIGKPLRILSPQLYQFMITQFKTYNIHSYDLIINGIKKDHGIEIEVRFGEKFTKAKSAIFSTKVIDNQSNEHTKLTGFIDEVAETCKKVMIDEYFERMAP